MNKSGITRKRIIGNNDACLLCQQTIDDELMLGKFCSCEKFRVHYYCMLFASGLEQGGDPDEDGILGFLPKDILVERKRSIRLRCCYCKQPGATIGCNKVKCRTTFHLPCGIKNGSFHRFRDTFPSYCWKHKPKQTIMEPSKGNDDDICTICFTSIELKETGKAIYTPCCQHWLHHSCIQEFALNSGYFFRCPLCNNKDNFVEEMLQFGIYVPEKDASWELEENAFSELLYRPSACKARRCLCKEGRQYNEGEWRLIICSGCGSTSCHASCAKISSHDIGWHCRGCCRVLHKNTGTYCKTTVGNEASVVTRVSNMDDESEIVVIDDTDMTNVDWDLHLTSEPTSTHLIDVQGLLEVDKKTKGFNHQGDHYLQSNLKERENPSETVFSECCADTDSPKGSIDDDDNNNNNRTIVISSKNDDDNNRKVNEISSPQCGPEKETQKTLEIVSSFGEVVTVAEEDVNSTGVDTQKPKLEGIEDCEVAVAKHEPQNQPQKRVQMASSPLKPNVSRKRYKRGRHYYYRKHKDQNQSQSHVYMMTGSEKDCNDGAGLGKAEDNNPSTTLGPSLWDQIIRKPHKNEASVSANSNIGNKTHRKDELYLHIIQSTDKINKSGQKQKYNGNFRETSKRRCKPEISLFQGMNFTNLQLKNSSEVAGKENYKPERHIKRTSTRRTKERKTVQSQESGNREQQPATSKGRHTQRE